MILDLFHAALRAVDGKTVVQRSLAESQGEFALVALGKAAGSMTRGALAVSGIRIPHGFLCTPHRYQDFTPPPDGLWTARTGGHPLPDASSLAAGADLVEWLQALPRNLPLLVLMSGGSSACIELLSEGLSLEEAAARTNTLLASGADIRAVNAVRSEWSLLKRGRALEHAGHREVRVLVLSDVPGDDPALVGSGPFHGTNPSVSIELVATNQTAVSAIVETARKLGMEATVAGQLEGDAARQGATIAGQLLEHAPGIIVWGGETTVTLPANPGRGGRCQHLALAAAIMLEGHADVRILAAGTDGVDGTSGDAGALVDGQSVSRMRTEGINPEVSLMTADSGTALAAAGDLIHTGTTGTNVMDIVIASRGALPRGA